MRSFYACFFRNLIWIYLCVLICFSYSTMLSSVPDRVYLEEGQTLALDQQIPIQLAVYDQSQETMSDIGMSTYKSMVADRNIQESSELEQGSYDVMCYLFGLFPIKKVEVSVVRSTQVCPAGSVVGIYGATDGVFVLGSSPVELADGSYAEPAEHIIYSGDYITAVNGNEIHKKEELIEQIRSEGEKPLILTVNRKGESIQLSVQAVRAKNSLGGESLDYMLGIWVKDDMAGIGTLTYYDREGNFGALGHGIGDGETGDLLRMSHGNLYQADILSVKKGKRGEPGELQGVVYYGRENLLGEVNSNTDIGIYGKLNQNYMKSIEDDFADYQVAFKQDVKLGNAVILSNISGEDALYHIVIDSCDYSPSDSNKGIRFHVDDENLLNLTGGIVQGLSGSPILQNGKLVGAVTHVLVNDPTKGYGIFIENMMEH